MLLWLKTALLGCRLTELQKQAKLVAKFGEYLKSGYWRRKPFFVHHYFIIS